ncbi:MAG: transposase [Acidimicrobiia bacterium]|nr:transposase [Acidimicrobiia bacterium]MDH4364349.1 transposase [Acidimicrobiia bacterium]MDH5288415.1 transposase [Acidimicrobiia bacterium]
MGGKRYPGIERLRRSARAEFVPFLAFAVGVRRGIFSANAVGSLNAWFRRATRARGHVPIERATHRLAWFEDEPVETLGGNLVNTVEVP